MESPALRLQNAFDDLAFTPRVSMELCDGDGGVELLSLTVEKEKVGLESAAVRNLAELADEQGVDLTLVVPGRAGRPKFNKLVDFYRRFGFELGADDRMRRAARPVLHPRHQNSTVPAANRD